MNPIVHKIRLDATKYGEQESINVKRNDTKSRLISATILSGGKPFELDDTMTVVFKGIKSDGTQLFNSCAINGSSIEYLITTQTISAAGTVQCEFTIYGADDEMLASPRFSIEVEDVLYDDGGAESTDEHNALAAFQVYENYHNAKTYIPLNKAVLNGSSYICITTTTGNPPPNPAYWLLIAAAGGGAGDMLTATYDPNHDGIIGIPQGGIGADMAAARAALSAAATGFVQSGSLTAITEPGVYHIGQAVTDKPTTNGGILIVSAGGSQTVQIYVCSDEGSQICKRRRVSGAWNAWDYAPLITSGTWTPTLYGASTPGSPAYIRHDGHYIKIGNFVFLQASIKISNRGGMNGQVCIGGLPFATGSEASGLVGYIEGTTATKDLVVYAQGGATYAVFSYNNAGSTIVQATEITDSFGAYGMAIPYHTA